MSKSDIIKKVANIIEKHVKRYNLAEVSGIIELSKLETKIIKQRKGDANGVGYYTTEDLINIYLSNKTEFVMYHSHPNSWQDAASPTDTKN